MIQYLYFDLYIDILSPTICSPKRMMKILRYMTMKLVWSTSRVNSDATAEYFAKSF